MKRNVLLLFAVLLTLTVAGSALAGRGERANRLQLGFIVALSNAQVVPPLGLHSEMVGEGWIAFDRAMRSAQVFMKISDNFSGVGDIHLHLGEAGAGFGGNDIVVTVEHFVPPVMTRTFTVLEVFSNARVETVDSVNNIASLYQAVRDGRVYIDVHTRDFLDGEIRGQIYPSR